MADEQLELEKWYRVRYSHGQVDIVPESEMNKILKTSKNVFEVTRIHKKE